jgi:hypothetical protein
MIGEENGRRPVGCPGSRPGQAPPAKAGVPRTVPPIWETTKSTRHAKVTLTRMLACHCEPVRPRSEPALSPAERDRLRAAILPFLSFPRSSALSEVEWGGNPGSSQPQTPSRAKPRDLRRFPQISKREPSTDNWFSSTDEHGWTRMKSVEPQPKKTRRCERRTGTATGRTTLHDRRIVNHRDTENHGEKSGRKKRKDAKKGRRMGFSPCGLSWEPSTDN